jgi:hypothetical protein
VDVALCLPEGPISEALRLTIGYLRAGTVLVGYGSRQKKMPRSGPGHRIYLSAGRGSTSAYFFMPIIGIFRSIFIEPISDFQASKHLGRSGRKKQ